MPMENSTSYAGGLPGTMHSSLPWDPSLILSNKDTLLTSLKEKKEEKAMPYIFISWTNDNSFCMVGLGSNWSSVVNP